jgi:hypothetical protein
MLKWNSLKWLLSQKWNILDQCKASINTPASGRGALQMGFENTKSTFSRNSFYAVLLVEMRLSYCRRLVDQFDLVSGSPLGPMTRFCPYPFFSDNCFVVLPVGRPLWREDGSVTYSADWSGHWGPITIHYRLFWDCVPSLSPLTTRRDCGGGILTRLHTGAWLQFLKYFAYNILARTAQKSPFVCCYVPSKVLCIIVYLMVVAQQRSYMPQYIEV